MLARHAQEDGAGTGPAAQSARAVPGRALRRNRPGHFENDPRPAGGGCTARDHRLPDFAYSLDRGSAGRADSHAPQRTNCVELPNIGSETTPGGAVLRTGGAAAHGRSGLAPLTAILRALARAVWRDLRSYHSLTGNNFFLFVLLLSQQVASSLFFALILALLLLFPLSADPLAKVPRDRLELWPLSKGERILL